MKKSIGPVMALYPTPLIVVGAIVKGKPSWTLVAHIGIPSHDMMMVSLAKAHYINQGIKENKSLSINVVDESWLDKADEAGCISGHQKDKSTMFEYTLGETGAPMINQAKLSFDCKVVDVYEASSFENFMLKVANAYAEETILNQKGDKPDFDKFKPVLFEMPNYTYLETGKTIAKCMSFRRKA